MEEVQQVVVLGFRIVEDGCVARVKIVLDCDSAERDVFCWKTL